MTTVNNSPFELSKLTIDRSPQNKKTGFSAHLSNVTIFTLLATSLFFIGQNIFFTTLSSTSKTSPYIETDKIVSSEPDLKKTRNAPSEKQVSQSALDASGHVVARRIATVSSRVTGKLNLLNIEEGQRVSKFEILAELDDKQAEIAHQLAMAQLSAEQASYEEFALLFQQQNLRFDRNKLLAKQALISKQILEDSEYRNAQLAIQVRNKQALVHLAEQRVELALYQLNQHKIRAPFDGVVISKNAQVGELISAGSSGGGFIRTGVGTIVDMSSLEIEVEVGESYINRVYPGQKVVAKLDAYPQWKIKSEVVAVIPTADRQKASIKVRVKIFAVDPRILPDMGVKVSFMKSNDNSHKQVAAL